MISICNCRFHRRTRLSSALRSLYTRPKTFVIRIEVVKKIFGIDSITWFVCLQNSFEKPGSVTDVPAWRAHEIGRLNYVVFYFERRHNLHRSSADAPIEIDERFFVSRYTQS